MMGFFKNLISFLLLRIVGYGILIALMIAGYFIFVKIMMAKYGL